MGKPRDEDLCASEEKIITDLVDDLASVDEDEAILAHIHQQDPYVRFVDGQPI